MSPHSPLDTGSSRVPLTPQQTPALPSAPSACSAEEEAVGESPLTTAVPGPFSVPTQAPSCPGSSFPGQLFPELSYSPSSRQTPHISQHSPSCTFPTLILLSCFTCISFSVHLVSLSCFTSLLPYSQLFYQHKPLLFF